MSFYSWHPPQSSPVILAAINQQLEHLLVEAQADSISPPTRSTLSGTELVAGGSSSSSSDGSRPVLPAGSQLRVVAAQQVDDAFHATFSACWRRYVYLLPLQSRQHHTCELTPAAWKQQRLLSAFEVEGCIFCHY